LSCHETTQKTTGKAAPCSGGKQLTFALAGNANVGKSVIFNQLTGSNQIIGNWPGKTVDRAEGTLCFESKNPIQGVYRLVEAIDQILEYDERILVLVEPKPNEPIDRSFCPTLGHVIALASRTKDPDRVGCLLESAHAILAGLDPAGEIAFGLALGKLWSVHLNDQNGLKFDQDRPFGCTNLRSAFDQVRALERNGYGKEGQYVAFDVHPFRTSKVEHWTAHLVNSRRTFLHMVEKARSFDEKTAQKLIADRNYQALDQMVIEHLLGV
jgi:xylose isomerase